MDDSVQSGESAENARDVSRLGDVHFVGKQFAVSAPSPTAITRQPRTASIRAVALPIPLVPPVTNATGRPSSLIGSMCTIIARWR